MKYGMCLWTLVSPAEHKRGYGRQEAISKSHLKIKCTQSPEGMAEDPSEKYRTGKALSA